MDMHFFLPDRLTPSFQENKKLHMSGYLYPVSTKLRKGDIALPSVCLSVRKAFKITNERIHCSYWFLISMNETRDT